MNHAARGDCVAPTIVPNHRDLEARPGGVEPASPDAVLPRDPAVRRAGRRLRIAALVLGGATIAGGLAAVLHRPGEDPSPRPGVRPATPATAAGRGDGPETIALRKGQQEAIELKTARAVSAMTTEEVDAPGRVAPDQEHFAFITPRAPGVVRSVAVNIGQEVRKGQVLATIDSPEVGRARLELRTARQNVEVAETQARWQEAAHANAVELVDGLRKGEEPDAILKRLEGRPVGAGRERIMTAYAQYRLASAALERNKGLVRDQAVSLSQFQRIRADYESASASYKALLDSTLHDSRLANLRAQQALRQAETAVGVAQERLKILGVEGEPSPGASGGGGEGGGTPLSTYTLVAPFDGTVLDRTLVVPGVSVDVAGRLFTIADLSTVWLEVNVPEGDFDVLARAGGGEIAFDSPAYPGRDFLGKVIYRGDLVDEASRSVKLLAAAENPERLLKPGMFINARIRCPGESEAATVPESAVVTEGGGSFVFVKTGPEQFERREVGDVRPSGGRAAVGRGLRVGEEVVIEGASKLKAKSIAEAGRLAGAPKADGGRG